MSGWGPVGTNPQTGGVSATPPGWPAAVPPPGAPGWQPAAASWLLDHCPPDYRAYAAWRRHPVALAWVTVRHVDAQLAAMREAYRQARVELGDVLPADGLEQVLENLEAEGLRLRGAARSARLLQDALRGKQYIPRL